MMDKTGELVPLRVVGRVRHALLEKMCGVLHLFKESHKISIINYKYAYK